MWSQTYTNGHRYYREQRGSRGTGYCVDRNRSMVCEIPDEQMGRIIEAIALPETWQDRILAGRRHTTYPPGPFDLNLRRRKR